MIMTCTIKELMRLLSYEQDLKSLELKKQVPMLNSLKERCMSFIDDFVNFYLNLSIGSIVLLRGTRNYGLEML